MGDRGNIVIVQHAGLDGGATGAIYLYAHWSGSVIARVVQCALLRAPDRWDDEPYLGRIIFSELTAGSEHENLSFGISTYLTDNEHDLVVVDAEKQTVTIQPEEADAAAKATYGFAEFAKKDLLAAHLVEEPMDCMSGVSTEEAPSAPVPLVPAPPPKPTPARAPVGGHLPYALAGALVGAVVGAVIVSLIRGVRS
jgi:hypothetical protein